LGPDGSSFVEFAPDSERSRKKQQVFICVILGKEPKVLGDPEQALDVDAALREMGWIPAPEKDA
jgi:hypothetical protein